MKSANETKTTAICVITHKQITVMKNFVRGHQKENDLPLNSLKEVVFPIDLMLNLKFLGCI